MRRKIPKVGDLVLVECSRGEILKGICEKVSGDSVLIKLDSPRKMTYSEEALLKYMKTSPDLMHQSVYKGLCDRYVKIVGESAYGIKD